MGEHNGETVMARGGKLSATKVDKTRGPTVLHDGGGLYLRIAASGARSWVLRYQIDGKRRDMGMGAYPLLGLAEARQKAMELRRLKLDGRDPLEARKAERRAQRVAEAKGRTFRDIAEEYIKAHKAAWKNEKHAQQWPSTLGTYVYPIMGDLPVQAIDVGLVTQVMEQDIDGVPFWQARPATASRTRGRVEAILDAAIVRGYRERPNPAQWKGNLAHVLPARDRVRRVEHHAALPYAELPAFFAELRHRPGMGARALEFTILAASRTGETIGAVWSEIDLAEKMWTIPAGRMKATRQHRIPLSATAIAVLESVRPLALQRNGEPDPAAPVFPGLRRALPLSSASLLAVLRRMGCAGVTTHGFRSSFSDWCTEQTAFPSEVRELALAHTVGTAVERAYMRSDLFEQRRRLMEAWSRFCTTPTRDDDRVVAIGSRRT
jgi:integrase